MVRQLAGLARAGAWSGLIAMSAFAFAPSAAADATSVVDGRWVLASSVAEEPPSVTYADGRFKGYAQCDFLGGVFTVSGTRIIPGESLVIDTRCSDRDRWSLAVTKEAHRFQAFLGSPVRFKVSGDRLVLIRRHGRRIQLRRAEP